MLYEVITGHAQQFGTKAAFRYHLADQDEQGNDGQTVGMDGRVGGNADCSQHDIDAADESEPDDAQSKEGKNDGHTGEQNRQKSKETNCTDNGWIHVE